MKTAAVVLVVVVVLVSIYMFGAPIDPPVNARTTTASLNADSEIGPESVSKTSDELLEIVASLGTQSLRLNVAPVKIFEDTAGSGDLALIDRSFACAEGAPIPAQTPQSRVEHGDGKEINRDHRHALTPGKAITINVFVTKNGEAALHDEFPRFPLGTVVLKEKILQAVSAKTLLYTGMLKREAGYNPECGDWEFFVVSGDGKKVTTRGKFANCMKCHKDYPRTDFITKTNYSGTRKSPSNANF